ncbi:hypothetical protein D3C72_900500 [compost metagenome]
MLRRPFLEKGQRFRRDRFGIDGDEGFGAAERNDISAIMGKDVNKEIARHGAVLVNTDLEAGERLFRQQRNVALVEKFGCGAGMVLRRRRLVAYALRFDFGSESGNRRLVLLVDFAVRAVELDAVAVGRDMRACYHQRACLQRHAVKRKRRCRHRTAIERRQAGFFQRSDAGGGNIRARITEIAADENGITRLCLARCEKMPCKCRGIDGRGLSFQIDGEAAKAARSKFQAHAKLRFDKIF